MLKETGLYSSCYQLVILVCSKSKSFPKQYRPTFGRRLEERCLDLLVKIKYIITLSGTKDRYSKLKVINEASNLLDELRVILQVSHDLTLFSSKEYASVSELTDDIGRQVGGFKKYIDSTSMQGRTPTEITHP